MCLKAQNTSVNTWKFSVRKYAAAETAISVGTKYSFWVTFFFFCKTTYGSVIFSHLHEKCCDENVLDKAYSHHHKHWDYHLRKPVNPRRTLDTSYFLTKKGLLIIYFVWSCTLWTELKVQTVNVNANVNRTKAWKTKSFCWVKEGLL